MAAVVVKGPVAVPDVPGYLSYAQWPAGGLTPSADLGFFPGYGLLLAPVALVATWLGTPVNHTGQLLHTAALVLNAAATVAAAALALRLWRDLRNLPAPKDVSADGLKTISTAAVMGGLVVVLAVLHPSLSVASLVAWPEALLAIAVLGVALALVRPLNAYAATHMAVIGFAAGLVVAIHPRAVVLSLAVLAAVALTRGVRQGFFGALLVGLAAAVVVNVAVLAWVYTGESPIQRLWGIITGAATGGATTSNSVPGGGSVGVSWFSALGGQLVAIAASSMGLALVGLVAAGRATAVAAWARLRPPDSPVAKQTATNPPVVVGVFLFVSTGMALILAAFSLVGSNRGDVWAYGRYLDPYVVALSIYGLCFITQIRLLVTSLGVLAVAVVASAITIGNEGRPPLRIMVLGNDQWWLLANHQVGLAVALLAAAATIGLVLLIVSSWPPRGRHSAKVAGPGTSRVLPTNVSTGRPARASLVAFTVGLGVMLGAATFSGVRHVHAVGQVAVAQSTLAATVADLVEANPSITCLAHDNSQVPSYARWLYAMQLPSLVHQRVSLERKQSPCSSLIIATTKGTAMVERGAELLGKEPRGSWGLWQLPN